MIWRRLWPLLSTLIVLTIVQKSACFRIVQQQHDGATTTNDETQTTPRNSESDNGPEKEPDSNSNIQLDKSEPKIIPEKNYTVKPSPAEMFKGIGKNPAIRKMVEKGDPQLLENFFMNYMKTSQPDIAEIGSVNRKADIESDKSMADNQVDKKLAQPEYTKKVIATSKKNENLTIEVPKQLTEQKEDKLMNAANPLPAPVDETFKYLNAAGLTQMTQSIGKGEAQSVECDFPHLDIYSRCFANVMEVTVTSRSVLLGRISFQEAQGHIDMNGNDVTLYAVYGVKTTTGFMWRLQKGVTAEDVDVGCKTCHILDLRMMVLVMEDFEDKNKRCVIDLTCTQPNMPNQPRIGSSQVSPSELPQESVIKESDTSRVHSAKTTLNILKGTSMDSEVLPQDHFAVELGTKLGLIISAYTKDITLDLHIHNCEARGEDGRGITLTKDGCSAHHMVREFQEILGVVHDPEIDDHHVVRVTQHTTFDVFNFSPKPQTFAIICKIKMCGGECEERPACVNSEVNLSHRKQKSFTVFSEEVVLGQMLNVAGLPEFYGAPKNLDLMSNIIEPEEEAIILVKEVEDQTMEIHANCIPRSVFYITLSVLAGLFLLLLVLGLYFSKAIVLPRIASSKLKNLDEVESPGRAFYQEYSSPRRRSPGTKTPDQNPILNKIVYS